MTLNVRIDKAIRKSNKIVEEDLIEQKERVEFFLELCEIIELKEN